MADPKRIVVTPSMREAAHKALDVAIDGAVNVYNSDLEEENRTDKFPGLSHSTFIWRLQRLQFELYNIIWLRGKEK